MSKKNIITGTIFLVLSVVVTFGLAIGDAMYNRTSIYFGVPFKFASASLFGEASTDYLMFILDIFFWFIILFGIWKLILKIINK